MANIPLFLTQKCYFTTLTTRTKASRQKGRGVVYCCDNIILCQKDQADRFDFMGLQFTTENVIILNVVANGKFLTADNFELPLSIESIGAVV